MGTTKSKSPQTASPPVRPTDAYKDTLGRWRTRSLFIEYEDPDYPPFFTLAESDDPRGYVSLKAKYLEYADPTEYIFARKVFGSWEPWEKLICSNLLQPHIAVWRMELAKKLESEAHARIRTIAEDPLHPQHLSAARLLLQRLDRLSKPTNHVVSANYATEPQRHPKLGRRHTATSAAPPPTTTTTRDWEPVRGVLPRPRRAPAGQ